MKRKRNKRDRASGTRNKVLWFLDENVAADPSDWLQDNDNVETASTLDLRATKDETISKKLTQAHEHFVIVTSNRKTDKKGDHFRKPDEKSSIVYFSSELANKSTKERQKALNRFRGMFKSSKKIKGATVTLGSETITYKKGSKSKTIPYKKYIL